MSLYTKATFVSWPVLAEVFCARVSNFFSSFSVIDVTSLFTSRILVAALLIFPLVNFSSLPCAETKAETLVSAIASFSAEIAALAAAALFS